MMNNNQPISVIDIGTTKIVALIGKKEEDNTFTILGVGHVKSKGVLRGTVFNIKDTVDGIKEAVEKAEKVSGVKMNEVYVGIAGQNIKCLINSDYINRTNSEQEISSEELERFVKNQENVPLDPGQQILHVIPKSFTIDGEQFENPVGCIGKRLEAKFHIVVGQSQNINSIKRCITNAGLKLNKIILEPIASSRAVLDPVEIEAGVAMIDIGGGTSDLAIYHKNMLLHTAVIPFGGNVITSDIEKAYNLINSDAEKLKVKFGKAIPEDSDSNEVVVISKKIPGREPKEIEVKSLSNIIQARLEEILGFIYNEIKLSESEDLLGAGIVITGGGSLLKNLPQLMTFCTALESRIGYPMIYVRKNETFDINNPSYSTAIGLLIHGCEDSSLRKQPQTEMTKNKIDENIVEIPQEKEKPVKEKKKVEEKKPKIKKPSKIFNGIKETFSGFFDSNDTNI
jgi:cell division protein FtsA